MHWREGTTTTSNIHTTSNNIQQNPRLYRSYFRVLYIHYVHRSNMICGRKQQQIIHIFD